VIQILSHFDVYQYRGVQAAEKFGNQSASTSSLLRPIMSIIAIDKSVVFLSASWHKEIPVDWRDVRR
jgi:hypothetical protein